MFPTKDVNTNKTKYVSPSSATVIDNKDPQKKGRIKVDNPIVGNTAWIPYLQLPHAFDVPEPGDIVYIQCDGGFETHPIAWGKLTAEASVVQVPDVFKRPKPTNRGFYTPGGHLIEFDDGDPLTTLGKGTRITTSDGSKIHISEDATDGKILLERKEGSKVEIDGILDKITVVANFGDELSVSKDDGIQASTPSGTSLSMKSGAVNLQGSSSFLDITQDGNITVENASGNKIQIQNTGDIALENAGGTKVNMTPTDFSAENTAGAKINMTPTSTSVKNAAGTGMNANTTTLALGNSSVELVDIVVQFLQELSTDTFAGYGAPAGKAAVYAALATRLAALKGDL
jgi:hypothetical protein